MDSVSTSVPFGVFGSFGWDISWAPGLDAAAAAWNASATVPSEHPGTRRRAGRNRMPACLGCA